MVHLRRYSYKPAIPMSYYPFAVGQSVTLIGGLQVGDHTTPYHLANASLVFILPLHFAPSLTRFRLAHACAGDRAYACVAPPPPACLC